MFDGAKLWSKMLAWTVLAGSVLFFVYGSFICLPLLPALWIGLKICNAFEQKDLEEVRRP